MTRANTCIAIALVAMVSSAAQAQVSLDAIKDKAGGATKDMVVKEINAKLLEEARKNQCSFKVDKDILEPGCDQKLKNLANALVDAKKKMATAGVTGGYRFIVSGHTDSTGKADHNKALSEKRAATIAKELAARGVPKDEVRGVGYGSERMIAKPDDTPAKKAKNRRYEIQLEM
jgi:OmpA-OmpF porin, OOP family